MSANNYSADVACAIKDFLESDDWHFNFDEENGMFTFNLSISGKCKMLNYYIRVSTDGYVVYVVSPIGADSEDKKIMSEMSDFICRANYGLRRGNFELDMEDGEIRYKIFVDCDGEDYVPAYEIIKNSIHCPASMFQKYSEGMMSVLFCNMKAKDAVEMCEDDSMDRVRRMFANKKDDDEDSEELTRSRKEALSKLLEGLEDDEDYDEEYEDDDYDDITDAEFDELFGDDDDEDDDEYDKDDDSDDWI